MPLVTTSLYLFSQDRLAILEERTRARDLRNQEICSNVTRSICSLLEDDAIRGNESVKGTLEEMAGLMLKLAV